MECVTLTPSCDRLKFHGKTILYNGMCSNVHETRVYVVVSLQLYYLKTMYYLKTRLHWHWTIHKTMCTEQWPPPEQRVTTACCRLISIVKKSYYKQGLTRNIKITRYKHVPGCQHFGIHSGTFGKLSISNLLNKKKQKSTRTMLYSFLGVIPRRLNFWIHCTIFIGSVRCGVRHHIWRWKCSEMSTHKMGNHPKVRIQHSEHGESLKSRKMY